MPVCIYYSKNVIEHLFRIIARPHKRCVGRFVIALCQPIAFVIAGSVHQYYDVVLFGTILTVRKINVRRLLYRFFLSRQRFDIVSRGIVFKLVDCSFLVRTAFFYRIPNRFVVFETVPNKLRRLIAPRAFIVFVIMSDFFVTLHAPPRLRIVRCMQTVVRVNRRLSAPAYEQQSKNNNR